MTLTNGQKRDVRGGATKMYYLIYIKDCLQTFKFLPRLLITGIHKVQT
jgi:hypothetical protein